MGPHLILGRFVQQSRTLTLGSTLWPGQAAPVLQPSQSEVFVLSCGPPRPGCQGQCSCPEADATPQAWALRGSTLHSCANSAKPWFRRPLSLESQSTDRASGPSCPTPLQTRLLRWVGPVFWPLVAWVSWLQPHSILGQCPGTSPEPPALNGILREGPADTSTALPTSPQVAMPLPFLVRLMGGQPRTHIPLCQLPSKVCCEGRAGWGLEHGDSSCSGARDQLECLSAVQ